MPLVVQNIRGDSMEVNDTNKQKNSEQMESKCFINLPKINNCVISFI